MNDDMGFVSRMFELTSHVAKCPECQEKMKQAQTLLRQVLDHTNNPTGE